MPAPEVARLPADAWPRARDLRVRALTEDPTAFGSTVAREQGLTPEQWRDRLAELEPTRSVLLVGPDAPAPAQALAAERGCLRAALLEPYGEPVAQPCGRCGTCRPTG